MHPARIFYACALCIWPALVAPPSMTLMLRITTLAQFHLQHAELLSQPSKWSMVLRRKNARLSPAELDAPVWHVTHLHKTGLLASFARNVPQPKSWPPPSPIRYAPWMQRIATRLVGEIRSRHTIHDYACLHARLGDWIAHNGLRNADFRPDKYAAKLHWMLKRPENVGPGKKALYLATHRRDVDRVFPSLSEWFHVHTSQSIGLARYIAGAVPEPTEDMFACIEQLVCIRSSIFVGTGGSSVTTYACAASQSLQICLINSMRQAESAHELTVCQSAVCNSFVKEARMRKKANDRSLTLDPLEFATDGKGTGRATGEARLQMVREYWEQQRQAGFATSSSATPSATTSSSTTSSSATSSAATSSSGTSSGPRSRSFGILCLLAFFIIPLLVVKSRSFGLLKR